MHTNSELNYRLYIQHEENFHRTPYERELERYDSISSGDVEKTKQNFETIKADFLGGKGTLSDNPLNNVRYHFIISTALIARNCVNKGMNHDTAYTISDIYIQRADKCTSVEKLIDMLGEMQLDFAERMKELKKQNVISLHIRKCIDYIYDNLHSKLTVKLAAEHLNLDPTYLSKLFYKETGIHFKDYITNARISAAKNMLAYSDFSTSDIAISLGFSSQSAFISVFKKMTGTTPNKFRNLYGVKTT